MGDPREAPEYVRVPVSTLVDFRAFLGEVAALRTEVAEIRADLHAHVQAERPVIEAHGKYLASLADEETHTAARAVADRRTADEAAAATRSKLGAIVLQAVAILAAALVSGLAVYLGASP